MEMKYIGPSISTIETGTILELATIKRTKPNEHFPSGISLGFHTSNGGFFGMSDRHSWIKVYQ